MIAIDVSIANRDNCGFIQITLLPHLGTRDLARFVMVAMLCDNAKHRAVAHWNHKVMKGRGKS
jgi:hypothetical protein